MESAAKQLQQMKKVTPGKQAIVAKVNGKKRVRDLPFQTESKR